MNNVTQRDAFWNTIYDIAREDRNVVLVSADMGAPSLDKFRRDLPSQFVNAGIAEQNAILIAAGLAMGGKKAFAYAIAPFITLRCLEQIRVNICMMKLPVTIVGVGAGLGYEDSGPTHHLTEDISVMRSLPGMVINSVTDAAMAADVAKTSWKSATPNYVRLERQLFPEVYSAGADFSTGVAVLKNGKDASLVATGCMVHSALAIAKDLADQKIDLGVIDVSRLPLNTPALLDAVKSTRKLITLEEHFLPGGFGSAVAEMLADHGVMKPLRRLGLPVERGYCYRYGGRENLRKYYGLDKDSIQREVLHFCRDEKSARE